MTKMQTSAYPPPKNWIKKAETTQLMVWIVYHKSLITFHNITSSPILIKLE